MKTPQFPRWTKIGLGALLIVFAVWAAQMGRSVFRWKTYMWTLTYIVQDNHEINDKKRHLIFIMTDHYEPGTGQKGIESARRWLGKFQPIAEKHRDSYDNLFKYTWFYPYDHHEEGVLAELGAMAYRGYGEVEMHWHLPATANSRNFPGMLDEAIAWFQRSGALISADPEPRTAFAFIAGNWGLDGSRPGWDSVYNQIDVLFRKGCYADFTFSTISTVSQPGKVNSLYYVRDDPVAPKSYDDGVDARVGSPIYDRLLIFEGPMLLNLINGALEYGAVEADPRPNPRRVGKWIDADIHVKGRPEWVFVKVYSHGAQSEKVILDRDLDPMLGWLEAECRRRGMPLHYMTAREAYNVIKAAEHGKDGDPEEYRDFEIKKPLNTSIPASKILEMNHGASNPSPPPWNRRAGRAVASLPMPTRDGGQETVTKRAGR